MGNLASRISAFNYELKRRKVFRVAAVYGVAAFAIGQVASLVREPLHLPQVWDTVVILVLILGFPLALALAWAFDITPTGVKRADDLTETTGPERPPNAQSTRSVPQQTSTAAPAQPVATPPAPRPHLPSALTAAPERAHEKPRPGLAPAQPPAPERVERASLAQLRDELRTPATAIVGYTRMLLADINAPDRGALRADLDKIRTAGELFVTRLEHLLDPEHPTWHQDGSDRVGQLTRMRHELRTPLNAVIGYSELILEEQLDRDRDQAVADDVRRILAAGRQALSAVDRVVHLAEAGKVNGPTHSSTVAQEVLAKLHPLLDASAMPLRQGTLLVVDDIEANRELIAHQLARQGYTVSKAANGRTALELLAAQEVDLILLDILMPEMDGVDVLTRLKGDPALSHIPVIVISAIDELDSVIRCIQMGAEDFLSKPFDPVLLGARIGTILELQRLRKREREYADALRRQHEWTDRLLRRAFPETIAARIKAGDTGIVESTAEASVLVAGIQGLAWARATPAEQVERVSELFSRFDSLAEQAGIGTIRTTGHVYVAISGLPNQLADHEPLIADLALALQAETRLFAEQHHEDFRLRIGIHVGPVVAGIISTHHVAFDLWGEGVETAEQLQLHAAAGTVQVSPVLYARLRDSHLLISRGVVELPGKGAMRAYLLEGRISAKKEA